MSYQSVYTTMYTLSAYDPYLVIQGQVTEGWDVLGPLHQDQQLLLHGLAHVCDGGDLFGPYVAVQYRSRGGDLDGRKIVTRLAAGDRSYLDAISQGDAVGLTCLDSTSAWMSALMDGKLLSS